MEDFENLSDEDIQQLMSLGIIPDEMNDINSQMEIANKIRTRTPPTGTDTGRVYVAASPLEHIAYAAQGIKAGRDLKKLRLDQQALLAQQIRGRSKYFQKMNDTPENRARNMQQMGVDQSLIPNPQVNY
jgi:hypothetical protein